VIIVTSIANVYTVLEVSPLRHT